MKNLLIIILILIGSAAKAQKIDSIYFNLYTDSLKKGTHNYINVDGKLSNGRYMPLNNAQIDLWCNTGKWEGNDLIIDPAYKGDSVVVKAILKAQPAITKTVVVYIKKSKYEGQLTDEKDLINNKKIKKP
ncbi:hypothetical protein BH11BAC6_BH11BAC6_13090 [soil metagenome]